MTSTIPTLYTVIDREGTRVGGIYERQEEAEQYRLKVVAMPGAVHGPYTVYPFDSIEKRNAACIAAWLASEVSEGRLVEVLKRDRISLRFSRDRLVQAGMRECGVPVSDDYVCAMVDPQSREVRRAD